jgi:hypothetical protein
MAQQQHKPDFPSLDHQDGALLLIVTILAVVLVAAAW